VEAGVTVWRGKVEGEGATERRAGPVKDGSGPVRARRGSSGGPWWTRDGQVRGGSLGTKQWQILSAMNLQHRLEYPSK